MAMTNAERQQRYRNRRKESGYSRINATVIAGAHACLKRIARYKGLSEREALEAILQDTEAQLIASTESLKRSRTKAYKNYFADF